MSVADRSLLLNPWTYLVVVLVLALTAGGSFGAGWLVRGWRCTASAGTGAAKVERAEDRRDENIDGIAAAAASAAAAAVQSNRSDTNESTTRIRATPVDAGCRTVPAPILRELQGGADAANAALGVGVRPNPASAGAADPE